MTLKAKEDKYKLNWEDWMLKLCWVTHGIYMYIYLIMNLESPYRTHPYNTIHTTAGYLH